MSNHAASGIARAAVFLSFAALLSRLLGFARDAVIAAKLGASAETDAYHASFLLPDLLGYLLLGGALSLAFQPLFGERMARGDSDAAWRLFSNVAAITALVVIVASALAFALAPAFVDLAFAFDAETTARVVTLTRIALVGPLLFALGGLLSATEQERRRFWPGAIGGLVYNVCIIAGGLLLAPSMGIAGFTIGVAVGALLGPFALPLIAARDRLQFRPRWPLFDADVRAYFLLALPLMLGVSLAFGDEWLGRMFASGMGEGEVSRLNNARRLLLLPVAFVGQAAGLAALPYLSALVAKSQRDELAQAVRSSVEATTTIATVAAVGLCALALPLTRFVYGRGAYSEADVTATAALLVLMAPAAVGWSVQTVLTRVSFAHKDTMRPMLLGTALLVSSIPLYALGARLGEISGLALATAASFSVSAPLYAVLVGRTTGLRTGAPLGLGLLRGLCVGLPAALLAYVAIGVGASPMLDLALTSTVFGVVALVGFLAFGGEAGVAMRSRFGRARRKPGV